jgi:hypothetical protein
MASPDYHVADSPSESPVVFCPPIPIDRAAASCAHVSNQGTSMKFHVTGSVFAGTLLALGVATWALSPDAMARKKEPVKPGWHVCGSQGTAEIDAIGQPLMKACEAIGADAVIKGTGGGSIMYCKDGQHTCCDTNAEGRITECSSVGGTPNSVLIPKRPTFGGIAADGKAPATQAQTPTPPAATPTTATTGVPPSTTKK